MTQKRPVPVPRSKNEILGIVDKSHQSLSLLLSSEIMKANLLRKIAAVHHTDGLLPSCTLLGP
jgi:hypothetical protein